MLFLELFFLWGSGVIISEFIQLLVDRDNAPSSFYGHSQCDHCHERIPWYGLIPIFGYFFVGGKCAHCKKKINPKYPLFELLFASFWGVTVYLLQGQYLLLTIMFALLSLTFYLAYYDYKRHEVPVVALGFLPVIFGFLYFLGYLRLSLFGAFLMFSIVSLSIFVVRLSKKEISFGQAFGPADWFVLLIAALFFDIEPAVISLIIAVIAFGIFYVWQSLARGKEMKGVPFLFWYLPVLYGYTLIQLVAIGPQL